MALNPLAGPFALTNPDGSAFSPMYDDLTLRWCPNVGLLLTDSSGCLNVSTLDGVCQPINKNSSMPGGWDNVQNRFVTYADVGTDPDSVTALEAYYDPKTWIKVATYTIPYTINGSEYYTVLLDRRIFMFPGGIWCIVPNITGDAAESLEYALPNNYLAAVSGQGRSNIEVFFGCLNTGDAVGLFYNTNLKQLSMPALHTNVDATSLVYAAEFGILITRHSNNTIQVWSMETLPVNVSTPIALNSVQTGGITTYQVQVTGSNSDPCAGELVNWTLTGTGTLLDTQSTTDVNGYATARVLYGFTGEDSTVEADLLC